MLLSSSNKSQGPDEIHPRLLKKLSSVIAEPLAKLFQNSLVQGVVPNDWREAFASLQLLHYSRKVAKMQVRIIDL